MSTNMEHSGGIDDESTSPLGQVLDQNLLIARRDLIIQKYLGKPMTEDMKQLHKWHEEYNMAEKNPKLQDPIIEDVQFDKLDDAGIERCIAELAEEIVVENRFCRDC